MYYYFPMLFILLICQYYCIIFGMKLNSILSNDERIIHKFDSWKKNCTSAPSSTNVSISTAVWMVMCKQPAMRAPFNGFSDPYFLRIAIKPGISFSAIIISLRPNSAKFISAEYEITHSGLVEKSLLLFVVNLFKALFI